MHNIDRNENLWGLEISCRPLRIQIFTKRGSGPNHEMYMKKGVPCYHLPLIYFCHLFYKRVFLLQFRPYDIENPEMTNKNKILLRRWHKNFDNVFLGSGVTLWSGDIDFCNNSSIVLFWPCVKITELHVLQVLQGLVFHHI